MREDRLHGFLWAVSCVLACCQIHVVCDSVVQALSCSSGRDLDARKSCYSPCLVCYRARVLVVAGRMKASNDYPAGPVDYSRQLAVSKSSSAVANVIIGVCHLLSFAPLVVIIVLQDVHLKLAIVLNTALCICLAVGNFCFHRMSVIQVRGSTSEGLPC